MRQGIQRAINLAIVLAIFTEAHTAWGQKKPAASSPATPASNPGPQAQGGTASNAPVEVEMLSLGGLGKILDKVAASACANLTGEEEVVVLDLPSLQALQAYDSFYINSEAMIAGFSAMAGASGSGSGIDDFADITSAVATAAMASTSETSFSFTIPDPSPALVLLNHLGSQSQPGCKSAHYGGVYAADETKERKIGKADFLVPVLDELTNLGNARGRALNALTKPVNVSLSHRPSNSNENPQPDQSHAPNQGGNPAPVSPVQGAPQTGGPPQSGGGPQAGGANPPAPTPAPQDRTDGSSQDPRVAAFNSLDATYNTFLSGLSAPNATTGQPLLSSILQGFRLRARLTSKGHPIVGIYVNVVFAGGTQQVRKNLITALFTGDWIRYSGGVAVNVIAFKVDGAESRLLFSDLLRYRTPLGWIKSPVDEDAGQEGDNLGDLPVPR